MHERPEAWTSRPRSTAHHAHECDLARDRCGLVAIRRRACPFGDRAHAEARSQAHLPTMHAFRFFVDAGGLMSYGATQPEIYATAAEQVAKILDGARPSELPLRQATRFELAINLKTAKALGLTIPQTLLLRADQVIQ